MSYHGIRRISSLITPLTLRELGLPQDVARLSEISEAWSQAVGPALAAQVRPIRYAGGKLVLRASSAAWLSRVRHHHDTLIRKLRATGYFRDLVGFEVRTAPLEYALQRAPQRKPAALSADTRNLLESVAADTEDPELRAALQRLARRIQR